MRLGQRRRRGGLLIADSRTSRRLPPLWMIAGVAGLGIVVYLFVTRETDDGPVAEDNTVRALETPAWHEAELNRPTLPGAGEASVEDVALTENTDDPLHIRGKVQRNQTIAVALRNRGVLPDRFQPVISAMAAVFDFRRSRPGDEYEMRLDLDGNVLEFRYQASREDIYFATLEGDRYIAEKVDVPKETRLALVEGSVSVSLFAAVQAQGEGDEVGRRFMDLFAFDFDFGSNSMAGDRYRMLVEKVFLEGQFYKYGRVLAAEYTTQSDKLSAYYYEDGTEDAGESGEYYTAEGRSLTRMFLKVPVRNAKMTSPFNLRRFHPILKKYRPHLGVDYAAPTGTPIMTIADGTVKFAGWKGGNGNLVVVEHEHNYVSVYAHLHGFARGIKRGKKVKQKDVVGYLGNTGLSTAPHLHFGIKKDGKYIDPLSIDTERGEQLSGPVLRKYLKEKKRLADLLYGKIPLNPTDMGPLPAANTGDSDEGSQAKKGKKGKKGKAKKGKKGKRSKKDKASKKGKRSKKT